MERAGILTTLRGSHSSHEARTKFAEHSEEERSSRFPPLFMDNAPENAQEIILSCLEHNPLDRPSAEELLKVSIFGFLILAVVLVLLVSVVGEK